MFVSGTFFSLFIKRFQRKPAQKSFWNLELLKSNKYRRSDVEQQDISRFQTDFLLYRSDLFF